MEILWLLTNDSNAEITGGAAHTTIQIRRVADGYFYDFDDDTFKASTWTTIADALSEIDGTNLPGYYSYTIDATGWDDGAYQVITKYSNVIYRYNHQTLYVKDEVAYESDIIALKADTETAIADINALDTSFTNTVNEIAAAVWTNSSRSLTDKVGFKISGTKDTLDALQDLSTSDVCNISLSDALVFTENTLADLLRKIAWWIYNKQTIDNTSGNYILYKNNGTTPAATGTITTVEGVVQKSTPTWS